MTTEAPGLAHSARPGARTIDLSAEAQRAVRQRRRTAILGVGIGGVFMVIGAVELYLLSAAGSFSGNTVVAAFLLALGGSIGWFAYRGGLRDPVARIEIGDDAVTFVKASARTVRLAWLDPKWDLEIQDPAPDPSARPEAKQHLFFTGVGPVYGTLSRSDVGPILDATREHGLSVTVRELTTGRRGEHIIRRIRIRPYR